MTILTDVKELLYKTLIETLNYWNVQDPVGISNLALLALVVGIELFITIALFNTMTQAKPAKPNTITFYIQIIAGLLVSINSLLAYVIISLGDCTYLNLFAWDFDAQTAFFVTVWVLFVLTYFAHWRWQTKTRCEWTLYQVLLILVSDIPVTIGSLMGYPVNGLSVLSINALVLTFGYWTYFAMKPTLTAWSQALCRFKPNYKLNRFTFSSYLYIELALNRLIIWLTVQVYGPWVMGLHENLLLKVFLLVTLCLWFLVGFKLVFASVHMENQSFIPWEPALLFSFKVYPYLRLLMASYTLYKQRSYRQSLRCVKKKKRYALRQTLRFQAVRTSLWFVIRFPLDVINYAWVIKQRMFTALDIDWVQCVVNKQSLFNNVATVLGSLGGVVGMAAGIHAISSDLGARLSADAGFIDHAKASETADELPLHRTDAEGQQKRTDYQNKVVALNKMPTNAIAQYEAALSHTELRSHICKHYNINCADPLKTKTSCSLSLKHVSDLMKQTSNKTNQ